MQILLDAFNDRRRALVIGVNPLGVQADGIRSEGSPGAAAGRSTSGRFENVDMNPDFTYTSKGRLTAFGYEVEILARLHHPGIAQVYDIGTLEDGGLAGVSHEAARWRTSSIWSP